MIVSLQFERSRIYNREFYLQDVTDGMPLLWKLPVDVVSESFQGLIQVAKEIESSVQLVFGLGFHSSSIEDDDHDALWLALFCEVRQPGSHTPNCSVTDFDVYIERKLSSIGSTQHVREEKWMCVSRDVNDGRDCQTKCVAFCGDCEGNVRCGFRQHSSIAKSDAAVLIALFYRCTMSVSMHFERSPICQFASWTLPNVCSARHQKKKRRGVFGDAPFSGQDVASKC